VILTTFQAGEAGTLKISQGVKKIKTTANRKVSKASEEELL
jgi:hypothetical protein